LKILSIKSGNSGGVWTMTNNTITIPPEALEAAEDAFFKEKPGAANVHFAVRAACLAMLNAWPGRKTENRDGWNWTDTGAVTTHRYEALILPLPKEPTDDK
jgi:hypothetical protein